MRGEAPPLRDLLSQRRAVLFIAIWMATNFLFGAGAQALGASDAPVAWIAHIGGFVAGLLAFPLFDRRRRREAAVEGAATPAWAAASPGGSRAAAAAPGARSTRDR